MVTMGPGVGEDKAAVAWMGSEKGFVWVVVRRTATSTVAMGGGVAGHFSCAGGVSFFTVCNEGTYLDPGPDRFKVLLGSALSIWWSGG